MVETVRGIDLNFYRPAMASRFPISKDCLLIGQNNMATWYTTRIGFTGWCICWANLLQYLILQRNSYVNCSSRVNKLRSINILDQIRTLTNRWPVNYPPPGEKIYKLTLKYNKNDWIIRLEFFWKVITFVDPNSSFLLLLFS